MNPPACEGLGRGRVGATLKQRQSDTKHPFSLALSHLSSSPRFSLSCEAARARPLVPALAPSRIDSLFLLLPSLPVSHILSRGGPGIPLDLLWSQGSRDLLSRRSRDPAICCELETQDRLTGHPQTLATPYRLCCRCACAHVLHAAKHTSNRHTQQEGLWPTALGYTNLATAPVHAHRHGTTRQQKACTATKLLPQHAVLHTWPNRAHWIQALHRGRGDNWVGANPHFHVRQPRTICNMHNYLQQQTPCTPPPVTAYAQVRFPGSGQQAMHVQRISRCGREVEAGQMPAPWLDQTAAATRTQAATPRNNRMTCLVHRVERPQVHAQPGCDNASDGAGCCGARVPASHVSSRVAVGRGSRCTSA
eukprot:351585-Chlamydomonas_euryale.AAC.8